MTERLDALLGKVTMYRLVLVWLLILSLISLVLGATGQVFYSPLAMLASAAVLFAFSWGANRLFGVLFHVSPHTPSAFITAGLLFFILPPSLTIDGLLVLAVAAVAATASKYLIAARGRHIVNPAAFGAFFVGILGLGFSAWWVATPLLLPFVVIGGFLILFRTRRLQLGITFIVVATVATVIRYMVTGASIDQALGFALVSGPIVFFACFMLSEPLTLPPRRWQQYGYAVLVALIYAIPFSLSGPQLGPITLGLFSTPEFALLIGNVVAFFFGQRRGIRLAFTGRRQLTPTSWEFEFQPAAPVDFEPGQFVELTLPHQRADFRGYRRTFSIASAPGDGVPVKLGLRIPEGKSSSFKKALLELPPGTQVTATAVGGDFLLPDDPASPVLLVAGGIGITPFIAQLEHATATDTPRDTVLVYAVSSTDEIAYAVELARSGARVLLASPEPLPRMPENWTWLGPDRVTSEALLAAVPDATSRTAYISGPPNMIAALKPALRNAGVRRVHTDAFIGY